MPGVADFLSSGPFSNFIELGRQNHEEDYDVDSAMKLVQIHFPDFMKNWQKETLGKLFGQLITSPSFPFDSLGEYFALPFVSVEREIEYMERAICVFRCNTISSSVLRH